MLRRAPLLSDETYHIFNRGAHKQPLFSCEADYQRFLVLLHFSNNHDPIVLRDVLEKSMYRGRFSGEIFLEPADKSLVDIFGYSLLPNHFHLILRQKSDTGITDFMRKLCVGYSMYYNLKYEHSGTLFQGRFKSSHINAEPYFKWIFPYVHLNPIALIEPRWQETGIESAQRAKDFLAKYHYSSYPDYYFVERPERAILAYEEGAHFIDRKADVESLIGDYSRGQFLHQDAIV